jgi:hypothetical protein
MKTIYWCEFPNEVDWKLLASWLGKRKLITYVTCASRKDYESWKKKIQKISTNIEVNAWPILSKREGYWFSSFSSKNTIKRLDEYKGITFKLDIEPPILPKYNLFYAFKWLIVNIFTRPKNTILFKQKIKELSEDSKIILSSFPLPLFILKRWGWVNHPNIEYNFMYYSTFVPSWLLWIYNVYYCWFMRWHPNSYFAVGLIGPGIFGTEPMYKNVQQLQRDITFLKKHGATNIVIFRLGSITKRGKEWFDATF